MTEHREDGNDPVIKEAQKELGENVRHLWRIRSSLLMYSESNNPFGPMTVEWMDVTVDKLDRVIASLKSVSTQIAHFHPK